MNAPPRPLPASDSRRAPRARYALPIALRTRRRSVPLRAEDVSFTGLFIGTEDPPPARQLIRLELLLPPFGRVLAAHAIVVRVVRGSAAGSLALGGMGVELHALQYDRATRAAWETFVARLLAGEVDPEGVVSTQPLESPASGLHPRARGAAPKIA